MATLTRLLSYDEWLAMPPAGEGKEEVVNGELQFMPPPFYPHAEVVQRLVVRLAQRLDEKRFSILGSLFALLISEEPLTSRSPDIAIFERSQIVLRDGLYCSAPGLVVEILSPSEGKRRKQRKLDDYSRIGVPEAWIVSPEAQHVEIWLAREGKLALDRVVVDGEIEPVRFAGTKIPVAEIWPE